MNAFLPYKNPGERRIEVALTNAAKSGGKLSSLGSRVAKAVGGFHLMRS